MKKILALALCLVLALGTIPSVYSIDTAYPELSLTVIDEKTVFPASSAPSPLALEDRYMSDAMPDHLQGQGAYGTCWAFSTTSLAEISLINKGLADKSIDLSEAQVAYNVYHSFSDKLGLLGNDSLTDVNGTWLEDGGSLIYSIWSLSAWKGICDEGTVPYDGITDDTVLTQDQQRASSAILTDALWFNMSQTDAVKNMIVKYGAVSASMYHNDRFFNSATNGYYQNVTTWGTNHAITIVGWDDSYSASNFNDRPAGDGAWICRNSWGTWWGEDGYCYISYYDAAVSASQAYALEFEKSDKYHNNYQYDGGLFNGYASLPAGYGYYNTFTATEDETLSAVGIGLFSEDAEYSVMIYDAKTNEPLLSEEVCGRTTYAGYYTIELPEKVSLKAGDEFSVYFSLQTSDGYAHIMVDTTYADSQFIFKADNENAKSYFTYEYGRPGYSMSLADDYDWCLRIKAYTEKEETGIAVDIDGDIDGDGKANLGDIFALKSQLSGEQPVTAKADLTGDGKVNLADIFYLRKLLLG